MAAVTPAPTSAPSAQATLSYSQLEGLWIKAGGNPNQAPLMAAIAEAESGGRPTALNPTDNNGTQTSWGLWQISNGTHSSPAGAGLSALNPLVNAQLAVAKYNSQGLSAWGTYDSGAYQQYLQSGTAATAWTGSTQGGPNAAPSTSASGASSGCLWKLNVGPVDACVLSRSQARAVVGGALVAGGGLVVVLGVLVLVVGSLGGAAAKMNPASLAAGAVGATRPKDPEPGALPNQKEQRARMRQAETTVDYGRKDNQRVVSGAPEVF